MAAEAVAFGTMKEGAVSCIIELMQDAASQQVQDVLLTAPALDVVTVVMDGTSTNYVTTGTPLSLNLGLTKSISAGYDTSITWRGHTVRRVLSPAGV